MEVVTGPGDRYESRSGSSFRDIWRESQKERLRLSLEAGEQASQIIALALADGALLRDPTSRGREEILQIIADQIGDTGTVAYGPLIVAYKMGLDDEVFSFIDRASFAHLFKEDGPPPAFNYPPGVIFDRTANSAMMEDVRFVGFCAKLGLCDYWLSTDRWPDCAQQGFLPYDFKTECRRVAAAS